MRYVNTCSLCRCHRKLEKSHLMPNFIYKYVSEKGGDGGVFHPVIVYPNAKKAIQIANQNKRWLLCRACESTFSEFGERPFAKIYKELLNSEISKCENIVSLIRLNEFDRQAAIYFAVSIFWRFGIIKDSSLDLSPLIKKKIKNFLLGENSLSKRITLTGHFFNNPEISAVEIPYLAGISEPFAVDSRYKAYQFWIPRLRFMLIVGDAPKEARKYCLINSSAPIISGDLKQLVPSSELVSLYKSIPTNLKNRRKGKKRQ